MRFNRGPLCLFYCAALILGGWQALHPGSAQAARVTPAVTNGGYMQTKTAAGKVMPLPLEHTDVDAEVAGFVAGVQVTQLFKNPYRKPIEAIYVFPLPHRAAIHSLTIRVGKRVIQGVVKRRAQARAIYRRAKARGQTAALLEQERPNIFTQSIANIMPGDKIEVIIRYAETLVPEGGRYEFVFPMVVGPRYVGGGERLGRSRGTGWGADTTRIRDASRITPRLLRKGLRPGYDISLRLRVNGGMKVRHLQVLTHAARVTHQGTTSSVVLDKRDSIPNKDFVVRYQLSGSRPEVAVLTRKDSRGGHFLLMIQPQAKMKQQDIAPREYIFVVDNSGSMSGFPMKQARAVVHRCLSNLGSGDTFQIIKFAGYPDQFAPQAVPATRPNIQQGVAYVEQMHGGGGTEFIPALKLALGAPKDPSRSRIVLFITDGYIGYEQQVLRFLRKNAKGINVFALGVGSSVNRFLIDGMARIGVGSPFYLLNQEKAASVVERIFSTISKPALTNIDIEWGGLDVKELSPRAIPDLFGRKPVYVVGRYNKGGSRTVTVHGRLAGRPFSRRLAVTLPGAASSGNQAIPYLWARRMITHWMDVRATEPALSKKMEQNVTRTALAYNLMSKFTSVVAVDRVVRNQGGAQTTVPVPVPLPQGVSTRAAPAGAYVGSAASARSSGVLGLLKSTPANSPNWLKKAPAGKGGSAFAKGSALGTDAQDALGGLIGGDVGGAYGSGGLGVSGVGRGGGGSGSGKIGLGTLGTIGRGGGGGSGVGYGRGVGRLRGRRIRAPRISVGQAVVMGSLSKEIIRRIIRRHLNQVRYCYQKELQANPRLAGRVVVKFTIDPSGKVVAVKVQSSTLNNKKVEQCVARAVKNWLFPKPTGGGVVVVSYPFNFKRGQK